MRSVARGVSLTAASLAVATAASGWIYLLRAPVSTFGPSIGDALPFDELSRHDRVSVAGFALVWLAAGALIAAIVRAARAGRVTAALLLALGVGCWQYLYSGLAVLIVRQVAGGRGVPRRGSDEADLPVRGRSR